MKQLITFIFIIVGISLASYTPTHATSGAYVALGDSVAAGAGLPSEDSACKRSNQAYAYEVASAAGMPLEHFACSGAKIDEGIYSDQKVDGAKLSSQLEQTFANGKPQLITMTIGANDTRWTQFIKQCYYIKCGYRVDTARFATYLIDLKLELNVAMAKIMNLSDGNPPQVIVTGYYSPLSKASCSDTSGLTSNEISWLKARTSSLNSAISGTVGKYASFAKYASVSFSGHELCSKEPWIQSLSDPMPFHPNAAGQQAIAKAVIKKYKPADQSSSSQSTREKILNWYNRYKK